MISRIERTLSVVSETHAKKEREGEKENKRGLAKPFAVAALGALVALSPSAFSEPVTAQRLLNADKEPGNWLSFYGNYQGWRYSPLKQVDTSNVGRLSVKWTFLPGPEEAFQAVPIVVDGNMYLISPQHSVFALDATNGKLLWRYTHKFPEKMPAKFWGGGKHRGVAVTGEKILMTTNDGKVLALDRQNGKVLWENQAADVLQGQGFMVPPTIVGNKAIAGVATSEFATRGFIAAYDTDSGKEVWRFNTTAAPGEPGGETWTGDSWKYGCGPVWMPPTYDATLNLIFVGTGNPCPMWDGDVRKGDNLYTNSILALDPDTGKLRWHYQVTPHDVWDLDAQAEVMLVDAVVDGRTRKLALQAGKNGFFYGFDRVEGRYLYGKPAVSRITWTKGLGADGRPAPGVVPGNATEDLCPGALSGAKGPENMSYSPQLNLVFIPLGDVCDQVKKLEANPEPKPGDLHFGGEFKGKNTANGGYVRAFDVTTGQLKWTHQSPYPVRTSTLATAGGLVFAGDLEGNAIALRADDGRPLWKFPTSSVPMTSMSYAVNGEQYIAYSVGVGQVLANVLPVYIPEAANIPRGAMLVVFALPD